MALAIFGLAVCFVYNVPWYVFVIGFLCFCVDN